jgi:hypothetical protein
MGKSIEKEADWYFQGLGRGELGCLLNGFRASSQGDGNTRKVERRGDWATARYCGMHHTKKLMICEFLFF